MRPADLVEADPRVTVHQCPGCELWQVDYDENVVRQHLTMVATESGFDVRFAGWAETLEAVLREHLAECPGLWAIVAETGRDPATLVTTS